MDYNCQLHFICTYTDYTVFPKKESSAKQQTILWTFIK